MQGRVDIINNTLGKALGGAAGDSSAAVPPLAKPVKGNTYFVASNHVLSNTTWQLFSHEYFGVWYCICMCIGGYTTGPKEVVALLRQRSRPYLFSNSLPPSVVAQALKVEHAPCHLVLCYFV